MTLMFYTIRVSVIYYFLCHEIYVKLLPDLRNKGMLRLQLDEPIRIYARRRPRVFFQDNRSRMDLFHFSRRARARN